MRSIKKHKWFGTLLVIILLVQWSYQTIHVLTSHIFETHIEQTGYHSQIDESNTACDFCAKLLGQFFISWSKVLTLVSIILSTFLITGKTANIIKTSCLRL